MAENAKEDVEVDGTSQPPTDWVLGVLVSTVNKSKAEFGITLFVGGMTLPGTLVSGRPWSHRMRAFEESKSESSIALLGALWDGLAEAYPAAGEGKDEKKRPLPEFVHLADAHVVDLPGVMPQEGMLWRGRLPAVDGWTLGTFRSVSSS